MLIKKLNLRCNFSHFRKNRTHEKNIIKSTFRNGDSLVVIREINFFIKYSKILLYLIWILMTLQETDLEQWEWYQMKEKTRSLYLVLVSSELLNTKPFFSKFLKNFKIFFYKLTKSSTTLLMVLFDSVFGLLSWSFHFPQFLTIKKLI